MVRSSPFHGGSPGSNPGRSTNFFNIVLMVLFFTLAMIVFYAILGVGVFILIDELAPTLLDAHKYALTIVVLWPVICIILAVRACLQCWSLIKVLIK